MTKFTLAEAIGNVDDKQIARALKFGRRANKPLRIAPLAACLMPAVLIVPIVRNGFDTRPPIDASTDSGDPNDSNDKNPGGATSRDPSKMEYNGEFFQFDHCVIRTVYDENNRIIDPVKADWDDFTRDTLNAADSLDELEFIGTGNVIGADPRSKTLYDAGRKYPRRKTVRSRTVCRRGGNAREVSRRFDLRDIYVQKNRPVRERIRGGYG